MSEGLVTRPGIRVALPGGRPLLFRGLVLDFNGTLATDGTLLPTVARRLGVLAGFLEITVLTADTFGTAEASLRDLPVTVRTVRTGRDKQKLVQAKGRGAIVAIGNGRNDVAMLRHAALGVAVLGTEGLAPELCRHADVIVARIEDALDLLLNPTRLTATLRR